MKPLQQGAVDALSSMKVVFSMAKLLADYQRM
jgi:hypothetical protein